MIENLCITVYPASVHNTKFGGIEGIENILVLHTPWFLYGLDCMIQPLYYPDNREFVSYNLLMDYLIT